jgi:hypothetical protein
MSFEIREATVEDAPGIRRLFARVFGVPLSAEEWEWKFARNPDGWFGIVAVLAGEIVGNYAGWAMRLRLDGERVFDLRPLDLEIDAVELFLDRATAASGAAASWGPAQRTAVVSLVALWPGWRRWSPSERIFVVLIAAVLAIALLVILAINAVQPIMVDRYLVAVPVLVGGILAALAAKLDRDHWLHLLLALVAVGMAAQSLSPLDDPD